MYTSSPSEARRKMADIPENVAMKTGFILNTSQFKLNLNVKIG